MAGIDGLAGEPVRAVVACSAHEQMSGKQPPEGVVLMLCCCSAVVMLKKMRCRKNYFHSDLINNYKQTNISK